jgi:putative transposase
MLHSGRNLFFTIITHQRRPIFSNPQNVEHLKIAIARVKQKYPFSLNAFVILPDHLHCIWKLTDNDQDFSIRWRLIKTYFSKQIDGLINMRKEKDIWQRRFWEHSIRSEDEWIRHMDYIHYNPVKHGFVQKPEDWLYSSYKYWV